VTAPSNDTKRGRAPQTPARSTPGNGRGPATSVVDGAPAEDTRRNGTAPVEDAASTDAATINDVAGDDVIGDDVIGDEAADTAGGDNDTGDSDTGEEAIGEPSTTPAASNGGSGRSSSSGFSKVNPPSGRPFLTVLQLAKEGDLQAFEEIFQIYHRRIYNAVYGMLGDPDDAQDVTQDVFMRLHDALPTLRADEAFSTYLYRIALNLCRDRARRKKRVRFQSIDTPRTDEEGSSEPMDFPDLGRLPEEQITNDELQRRVREAVGTLSADHKSVIVMHHFQGMEVNDIAQILNVPTGTVKSRLARGRDQLHRKLRSYLKPA